MSKYSIEEIKRLRDQITPGPWNAYKPTGQKWRVGSGSPEHLVVGQINDGLDRIGERNSAFIAASPTIVDQLVEEHEALALRAEIAETQMASKNKDDLKILAEAHYLLKERDAALLRARAWEEVAIDLSEAGGQNTPEELKAEIDRVRELQRKRIKEIKAGK